MKFRILSVVVAMCLCVLSGCGSTYTKATLTRGNFEVGSPDHFTGAGKFMPDHSLLLVCQLA